MSSPPVDLETFRRLDLRLATVEAVSSLLEDLAVATVRCPEPVEALVPASCLPAEAAGLRVVVALGLRPLAIGDRRLTAALATAEGTLVRITADLPDGARLA
jgi:hypothetical protein